MGVYMLQQKRHSRQQIVILVYFSYPQLYNQNLFLLEKLLNQGNKSTILQWKQIFILIDIRIILYILVCIKLVKDKIIQGGRTKLREWGCLRECLGLVVTNVFS